MNENAVSAHAVIGIDVAKKKVDLFSINHAKGRAKVFDNTPVGHRDIQRWLSERDFVPANTPVCLEATGPLFGIIGNRTGRGRLEGQRREPGTHQRIRTE